MKCGCCGKICPVTDHFFIITKKIPDQPHHEQILARARVLLCKGCAEMTIRDFGSRAMNFQAPDQTAGLN